MSESPWRKTKAIDSYQEIDDMRVVISFIWLIGLIYIGITAFNFYSGEKSENSPTLYTYEMHKDQKEFAQKTKNLHRDLIRNQKQKMRDHQRLSSRLR